VTRPAPEWVARLASAARAGQVGTLERRLGGSGDGRSSAVLMCFSSRAGGPSPRVDVLLMQRAATLRNHAGQVSFPGGTTDPGDADARETALREAGEEVGLDPSSVTIIGELPVLSLTVTGYRVTPVLAWWHRPHPVTAVDAAEVARVALVRVSDLVDPTHRFEVHHPSGRSSPGFEAAGLFIWGFTALLLDAVLDIAGWSLAWDHTVIRPVP
jgi:8-oxo-dGTP pyrophosphatase MutT (NUDIX family)